MKVVTYNIQYRTGADGSVDLGRIARAVEAADVIGLNEVERFWPRSSQASDQPAELSALLPAFYWVYGPYFDMDASERLSDGTIRNRRRQHGSMILSRTPIIASRLHLFPNVESGSHFNMQMGGVEATIDLTPEAVRVYAVHLSSLTSQERMLQARALLDIHRRTLVEGAMWSGSPIDGGSVDWSGGRPAPPNPTEALMMGDFNCEPNTPEYQVIAGLAAGEKGVAPTRQAFVDSWTKVGNGTKGATHSADRQSGVSPEMRVDYIFVSIGLADRLKATYVDREADGSDHQPVWLEIDL